MTRYEPGRFVGTYEASDGTALWKFLNQPDNLVRMEAASYLGRPAVEPLSPGLVARFGKGIAEDRMKQMLGHMVRQILEGRGYRLDRSNVRINRDDNIFSSGTRYIFEE